MVSGEAEIHVYAASLQPQNIPLSVSYFGCIDDIDDTFQIAVSRKHHSKSICVDSSEHPGDYENNYGIPKYKCSWVSTDVRTHTRMHTHTRTRTHARMCSIV